MDRRIQFAQTSDGVSIAFTDQGEGMPLVVVPNGALSHLLAEVTLLPERDAFLNRLAGHFRVIRFDARGGGMSQREGVARSFEAFQDDIDAVVDRLGLAKFALFGYLAGALVALGYAGRRPDRVSHLAIWPWYRMPDPGSLGAMAALERANWEAFTEMFGALAFKGAGGDIAGRYAALMREAMTPEGFADQWFKAFIPPQEFEDFMGNLAAKVRTPTLVIQPRERIVDTGLTRLVGMLQEGALTTVSGTDQFPYLSSADDCHRAISQFLDAPAHSEERRPRPAEAGLMTVMAIGLGAPDAGHAMQEALTVHGATNVQRRGTGLLASFASARRAMECAIALQRSFGLRSDDGSAIGLDAGEPAGTATGDFGASTRAEDAAQLAGDGRILVTNVVRELAAGKGFAFSRAVEVDGGVEPAGQLFELRWQG